MANLNSPSWHDRVEALLGLDYARLMNAPDLSQTFNYADAGTSDERVTSIVSTSDSLGKTLTETITYAGSSGAYRVATKTRAIT